MLSLFFEKTDKCSFIEGQNYFRVSNNLDSHYYVVERITNVTSDYISSNYFLSSHPQLTEYYTSWNEKEIIQQETVPAKNSKPKKGIIGGLLAKKNKIQSSAKQIAKQHKEEAVQLTKEAQVLYVQLESFSEVNVPNELQQAKEFMALIYLLSMRVYEAFKCWPQMVPIITGSKRYKFIKKGKSLEEQLVRLFQFTFKQHKGKALQTWSAQLDDKLKTIESQEEKKLILGSFLHSQLEGLLGRDFPIRLKKGQEWQNSTVSIEDCFTLLVKQSSQQVAIDEYEISYFYKNERRQILMQHNIESSWTLEGDRSNLIIRYLKQFALG